SELEDPIRKAVDMILCVDGDYRKGINPSLARVLRQQILWKDTQWIEVKTPPKGSPIRANMFFKGIYRP
ncbi:MAG: hypothetical protein D6785_05520, partial [Planctomycetota bacterium]